VDMTDDQWRYWEQCAERAANEGPADVKSAQEVVAELATYMLVDADRIFVAL
jgi:poly(3-hydroxybutyrate) depolymerase